MIATVLITWAVVAAALLYGNHRWRIRRPVEEVRWLPFLPPVPPSTRAASDAAWLRAWTFVDVDVPSVPFSWAEQNTLDEIERREFTGGAAA
jgi:hypothetical protein